MTHLNAADSQPQPAALPSDGADHPDWLSEFPPAPVCLTALHQDERNTYLRQLTEWVNWLVHRYGMDHRAIPACWLNHGPLLEELSALHTAWLGAFAHTARADAPLNWHTNFDAARQRLATWTAHAGCRPGQHRN